MTIPTIETENLRLRPFTEADSTDMHQILGGKDVLRYFPGTQLPSQEQVQQMIIRLRAHWRERGYGLWAVTLRSTGELLGRCGLQYLTETDEIEIDFILDRRYWGHGFATEAGRASLRYGFKDLGLATIIGIVHPENLASQHVLEKLGMQFVEKTEYFGMACYRYVGEQASQK